MEATSRRNDLRVLSHLVLNPTSMQNGYVKCIGTNELGEDSEVVDFFVSGMSLETNNHVGM